MAEGFRIAAAPTLTSTNTGTGATTIPSTVQTNDVIFLPYGTVTTAPTTVNAPTGGVGGWTLLDERSSSGNNTTYGVYYKVASGTPGTTSTDAGTTVTVANALGTGKCELHCLVYAGTSPNTPILTAAFALTTTTSTTFTTPTVSTTIDGAMTVNMVMAKSASSGATWTLPGGYVARSTALWGSGTAVMDGIFFDDNKNNDVNSVTSGTLYGGVTATCTSSDPDAYVASIALRPATVHVEPTGDVSNPGGWTATPSGTFWSVLDQDPIGTSSYLTSPSVPSAAAFTEDLATCPSPGINTGFAFEIYAWGVSATSASVVVTLFNSGTVVATWTQALTATPTSYLLSLTTTQAAGIQGSTALTYTVQATAS